MKRMLTIAAVIFFLAATIFSFRNLIPERENSLAMLVSDEKPVEYPKLRTVSFISTKPRSSRR